MASEFAGEMLILPQLKALLQEEATWHFTHQSKDVITDLIDGITTGRYAA